jgi:hypothetical protein
MPTFTDALSFITTCNDVDELRRLSTATHDQLKGLRAVESATAFAAIKVGDRVRIAANVNPKYLAGAEATVTEKRRTKVVVDFDVPHRRFHKGVVCPPEMLELG